MKSYFRDDGVFVVEMTNEERWAELHKSQHLRLRNQMVMLTGWMAQAMEALKTGNIQSADFYLYMAISVASKNVAENDQFTEQTQKATGGISEFKQDQLRRQSHQAIDDGQ